MSCWVFEDGCLMFFLTAEICKLPASNIIHPAIYANLIYFVIVNVFPDVGVLVKTSLLLYQNLRISKREGDQLY